MTGFDRRFIISLWVKTVEVVIVWVFSVTFDINNPSRKYRDTTALAIVNGVFHDNSFQRTVDVVYSLVTVALRPHICTCGESSSPLLLAFPKIDPRSPLHLSNNPLWTLLLSLAYSPIDTHVEIHIWRATITLLPMVIFTSFNHTRTVGMTHHICTYLK